MAGDRVSKVVVGNSGRQESDVDVKKEEERSLFAIGGGGQVTEVGSGVAR